MIDGTVLRNNKYALAATRVNAAKTIKLIEHIRDLNEQKQALTKISCSSLIKPTEAKAPRFSISISIFYKIKFLVAN